MTTLEPPAGQPSRDARPDRCPACGAKVPAGSAWCMLCHADLRTDEERAAARAAAAAAASAAADAAAADAAAAATGAEPAPDLVGAAAGRGRHRRGAVPAGPPAARPAARPAGPPAGPSADPLGTPASEGGPAVVEPAPPVASLDEVDVDAMLEQLAASSPSPLGELSGRMSDKTAKFLLVVGGAGLVTLVCFVGLVVLGLLVS